MIKRKRNLLLARMALPLGLAGLALPAQAQSDPFPFMNRGNANAAPSESIAQHLRRLANNPNDVGALIGAGRAALALNDAEAALGFFVRADEISPRNGQVKAGLGSALVRLERPLEAMQRFQEAEQYGARRADFAADRGFAFDLLGDPARAQADYRVALERRNDPEIVKRLAVSLAITGDQGGALAVLDPLLAAQDRTAWRTRAFIIALTGEMRDAVEAASIVLTRRELEILTPYLGRLPGLNAAGKAQGVHFGNFPDYGSGPTYALADFPEIAAAGTPGEGLVPRGEALDGSDPGERRRISRREQRRLQREREAEERRARRAVASRRRPGRGEPTQIAQADNVAPAPTPAPPAPPPPPPAPTPTAEREESVPENLLPSSTTTESSSASGPVQVANALEETAAPDNDAATPGFSRVGAEIATSAESAEQEDATLRDLGLSSNSFSLADLRNELRERAAEERVPPSSESPAPAQGAAAPTSVEPAPPPPPPPVHPAREWVQIATGPTQDGLRFTYRQLARANAVFENREGWYAPYGQTNRLLVGPFEDAGEAQQFLDALRAAGSDAFRWRSPAGEEVTRLYAEGQSPQPTANARQAGEAAVQAALNAHPARHWAQIGIGRQHDALRFTYRQYARRAPQAFQGKRGWWTSWGQTNRLLVGPFDSTSAAQAFLDAAEEEGEIDGFLFTSEVGQDIEPLPGR